GPTTKGTLDEADASPDAALPHQADGGRRVSTREEVEAHIGALDSMLDWAEKHELTLRWVSAMWVTSADEDTAHRVLLDGADPGAVRKVDGASSRYLVRDFGAGVEV